MERIYTPRDLIEACIAERKTRDDLSETHPYYQQRLEAFQQAFGIFFTPQASARETATLILFESTIRSYLALRTPFTGYLEFGPGLSEWYDKFAEPFNQLNKLAAEEHWKLLLALFTRLYGDVTKTITSAELLSFGFDDEQPEPEEEI